MRDVDGKNDEFGNKRLRCRKRKIGTVAYLGGAVATGVPIEEASLDVL
jgi:hypothetical protein